MSELLQKLFAYLRGTPPPRVERAVEHVANELDAERRRRLQLEVELYRRGRR